MAMGSGSVSNRSVSGKKERVKSSQKKESKLQVNAVSSSPAKRNKSPGIRVVGGRIYDSVNGKTCHQCRQKTRDFTAACTNQRNNKPCTIMYCHKCLLNRYGEKAEEVAALGEWSCPKCRGICNCSVCMKKRGHQPTGILINTAKATGFSSVSEMLLIGAERLNHEKVVEDSPKKGVVHSPRNPGKENSFDGKVDVNLPKHVEKKSKKVKEVQKGNKKDNTSLNIISPSPGKRKSKQEGLEDVHEGTKKLGTKETGSRGSEKKTKKTKRDRSDEMNTQKNDEENRKESSVHDDEKKPKKSRKDKLENDVSKKNDATLARRTSPRKLKLSNNKPNQVAKLNIGVDPDKNLNDKINSEKHFVEPLGNVKRKEKNGNTANDKIIMKHQNADVHADIPLPLGLELNSVAGIDVRTEEVGNALQFLEFCTVFGKILEMKKGQPEHVLQDLLHGRTGRRGKFSLTVQFHIHLLSILQSELGEECAMLSPSSWFHALKECLSESQNVLKAQGLESLDKAADYETLEASEKLRLLNLLCDEVLGTEKVRNWMDDQNTKHAEKVKEAKRKVLAAKDKEKSLKQKMKDDIAKAIIARHGALTISEHDSIISNIKRKAAQAHAEVLESKGLILKSNQTSDVVRVEPIFVGFGGHAYWKLKCFGKSDILRQDAGKGDNLTLDDKWFIIDDEGKEVIDKHISSSRWK